MAIGDYGYANAFTDEFKRISGGIAAMLMTFFWGGKRLIRHARVSSLGRYACSAGIRLSR